MYKFNKKMFISTILAFLSITVIVLVLFQKTIRYSFVINGQFCGYIKNKKILSEYYDKKLHNTIGDSRNVVDADLVDFKLELFSRDICLDTDYAIELLDKNVNVYVEGYELILDGNLVANIDSKEVFYEVKDRLIDYYLKVNKLESLPINWAKIKEYVEFKKSVVNSKEIYSEDELYEFILSNNKVNNILATVEIVATKTYLENNSGDKVQVVALVNRSNEEDQYDSRNFDRKVVKEITYNNDKYIGMKKISTEVLRPSLSEVQGNQLFHLNNPSNGTVITSPFGLRWGGEKHHGIDIAGNIGDPIFAAESGFANLVSYNNVYGNYIKLSHGKGVETLYGHCDVMFVEEGDYVTKGQLIGKIGNTGRSTGPHLHFEVRVNGKANNPLNYVAY